MPLGECMRKHTQRQLRVWLAWLEIQLNIPDRTAYYLAQLTAEVRRGHVRKPESVQTKTFIMQFRSTKKVVRDTANKTNNASLASASRVTVSSEGDESSAEDLRQQAIQRATAVSKSIWATRLGLGSPNNRDNDNGPDKRRGRKNHREVHG
jgi:hypothetical protein